MQPPRRSILPHALTLSPTGRGKGVGFVIPDLLAFASRVVVFDPKVETVGDAIPPAEPDAPDPMSESPE